MRRSICLCEPSVALAGEVNTWKFVYTSATNLPKGTLLKFDLGSQGRPIDWEAPDSSARGVSNNVAAYIKEDKLIRPKIVENKETLLDDYEFTLPSAVAAGTSFTILVGSLKDQEDEGNAAQTYVQRRRPFYLFVDPTGKGRYGDPEVFSMDVRGNKLSTIRILTPSFVARNRRFDITVRCEDQYGNLTANANEETLIELSYENLRETLNWKLFVPETGFITLPNLYFNEPGVYTIQLKNMTNGEIFRSAPIRCFEETDVGLYWGVFHGESDRVDSTENIESCLRHFRDDQAVNFFGTSPFESQEETPASVWKAISQNVTEFDEADRFVTFLGCQWEGTVSEEGGRVFVHSKDNKPIFRRKDAKFNTLKKIYRQFNSNDLLSIPTFTMGKGHSYDFSNWDPEFEKVVEIYNAWGSSEMTKKAGNTMPIGCEKRGKGIQEAAEGSVVEALMKNCRFGFVAGGLDDRGIYGDLFESDQLQYPPGMTAVVAEEQSRDSIFKALHKRRCYATTGERIILGIHLAGFPMGSEVSTEEKPGLTVNRHIHGFVAGTTELTSIELIRNGKVIKTFSTKDYHIDYEYDDMEPLDKVTTRPSKDAPPFVFYYLRVTQKDGNMAWSSPIWVDLATPSKGKKKR